MLPTFTDIQTIIGFVSVLNLETTTNLDRTVRTILFIFQMLVTGTCLHQVIIIILKI